MLYTADGITAKAVTLLFLVRQAYGIDEDNQIFGAPRWLSSATCDLEAKVDGSEVAELSKLSLDERRPMLQALLADRCDLKVHRETKELPVYALSWQRTVRSFTSRSPMTPTPTTSRVLIAAHALARWNFGQEA